MIGYKALHKDFAAFNNFKYEIGKTYELPKDEKLEICKCGFHFCKYPIDVYAYYSTDNSTVIVEVEALGDIVQQGTRYATDKIKILREYSKEELDKLIVDRKHNTGDYNTGSYNSGDYNTGNYNSGCFNTGIYNSGDYNSGDNNSGYHNSGHNNTGDYNSGCFNTGIYNSGNYNTGSWNSGDYNIGKCNTGDYNGGNYNTGYYNNGSYNTGYYNSGIYNTGIFNTGEAPMRAFNKETDMRLVDFLWHLDYDFKQLCNRIRYDNLLPEDRERIEALPNYDPDIFTKITGIKFD